MTTFWFALENCLQKAKTEKDFIKKLLINVRNALRDFDALSYERTHDRMYIIFKW